MDVIQAILTRRSIRRYQARDVEDEKVNLLLECARHAPSAGNRQPWKFMVVRDPAVRRELARAALDQNFVSEAPVVIVICCDPEVSASRYEDRGRTLYALQDTAAACQNILLAACGLGLGACWVGAFKESEVRKILNLPPNQRPVAMIPVGYPAEEREPRNLRPLEDVVIRS